MLYYISLYSINTEISRAIIAIIVAFIFSLMFGNKIINYLKSFQVIGQPIRDDGPQTHISKAGTPTIGGTIILLSTLCSMFCCVNICNKFVLVSLLVILSLGFLGFLDDYLKLKRKNHKGISAKFKFIYQVIVSTIVYFSILQIIPERATKIFIPFFNYNLELGIFFLPFVVFIITGASNAVNLTDGLDGLAIVPFGITTVFYGIIAYFTGTKSLSNYLNVLYIPESAELVVICASLIGASLGFLWFNAKPATVFMGDTGSLAIGGFLGVISILTKQEVILGISGAVFVIEALSVIIQVAYFKISKGKRVFKMAPIHHHYEKCGLAETKIVTRFWILSLLSTIIAIALIIK